MQLLNDVDDNSDSDLENPGEDSDAEPVGKDEVSLVRELEMGLNCVNKED